MKPTYTKLIVRNGELIPLPAGDDQRHELVRIEHPLLAKPLIVAAYALSAKPWKEAIAAAEKHTVYGLPMRAPTVEEAFFFCDRSVRPSLPKEFFPDINDSYYTWTSTEVAPDPDDGEPSGYAWGVVLRNGYCDWYYQSGRSYVRAVRAGQY